MSDGEVGVNPDRVAQAASALENLRNVLAANVPIITSTMNSYWSGGAGGTVSLAALQQAVARSPGDAADMRSRARLAAIAAATSGNVQTANGTPTVNIPWSGAALSQADAAAEAQALAAAEASNNPAAARAAIQAIQQDIQDQVAAANSGNVQARADAKTFLQTFYDQAAPQVANLAMVLHSSDAVGNLTGSSQFTVLTQADQQILGTYGQGLAVADKAGLSPAAVAAIVNTPNPWSAAMLVKYGPNGSAWATAEAGNTPSLLAQLTTKTFQAQQNGTLRIPLGMGSNTSLLGQGGQQSDGTTLLQDQIANFEPLTALLQADTQNKAAAWQVLGGSDGSAIARQLLNEGAVAGVPGAGNIWYTFSSTPGPNGTGVTGVTAVPPGTPGNGNLNFVYNSFPPGLVASFITAATSGGRGDPALGAINPGQLSAQSAVNVINNLPQATGKNSFVVDPQIQTALQQMMTNYRYDLAISATSPSDSGTHTTQYGTGGNAWGLTLTSAAEQNLMEQGLNTPAAFGTFLADVRANVGTAATIAVSTGDNTALVNESALLGLLQRSQNALGFDAGQKAALTAAQNQEMAGIAQAGIGTLLGFIPGGGLVHGMVDAATLINALSGPAVAAQLAPGDPTQAIQDGNNAFYDLKSQIWVPIANSLIANHIIPPVPPGQDPTTWVRQQLPLNLMAADGAKVAQLQTQLNATTDQNQRAKLQVQIDQLNTQIGTAQNLYDDLLQTAQSHISDSQ